MARKDEMSTRDARWVAADQAAAGVRLLAIVPDMLVAMRKAEAALHLAQSMVESEHDANVLRDKQNELIVALRKVELTIRGRL